MSDESKLNMVKTLLDISADDTNSDELISTYLIMAEREIVSWRYSYTDLDVVTVPDEYEMTQVMAVVAGFSQGGAENQLAHNENGIYRTFKYEDMIAYIRAHVIPYCKVM